ncbi:colipase-like protein 1, partial [Panthera onca]
YLFGPPLGKIRRPSAQTSAVPNSSPGESGGCGEGAAREGNLQGGSPGAPSPRRTTGRSASRSKKCKSGCCRRETEGCESHCAPKGSEGSTRHPQVGGGAPWGAGGVSGEDPRKGGAGADPEPRGGCGVGDGDPERGIVCCDGTSQPLGGACGPTQGRGPSSPGSSAVCKQMVLQGSTSRGVKAAPSGLRAKQPPRSRSKSCLSQTFLGLCKECPCLPNLTCAFPKNEKSFNIIYGRCKKIEKRKSAKNIVL